MASSSSTAPSCDRTSEPTIIDHCRREKYHLILRYTPPPFPAPPNARPLPQYRDPLQLGRKQRLRTIRLFTKKKIVSDSFPSPVKLEAVVSLRPPARSRVTRKVPGCAQSLIFSAEIWSGSPAHQCAQHARGCLRFSISSPSYSILLFS